MSVSNLSQKPVSNRLQKAIFVGVERWLELRDQKPLEEHEDQPYDDKMKASSHVLTRIPRREITIPKAEDVALPIVQPLTFKTSRIRAVGRLFSWFFLITKFVLGTIWDRLRRRDNETRRAVRLRQAFERTGGTFIKFGQQMSMRIDLLPWAYTVELAKMLDSVPPFSLNEAIEIIERTTRQPWQETFSVFDPNPIGSASIANVYQAILKNGDKVAVKVRRPGIGELFMADFKAIDWLLDLAEFLTLVRPGYTRNLRQELQTTLLEELDFIQEARFQDMFRRSAKKTGKRFFKAPRVYFELSGAEVIVQRYTSGMWLWEIMAGVEQKNPQALARMSQLKIDPKKVAKRLLWVNYWGMQENLIFHADPHPANVIVGRNSRLTFIDFGSCGSFNREQRAGLELTAVASAQNNAEGMARGTLKLFEPLPPLDVKELFQEAESEYNKVLTIFKSKQDQTEWWERTSVRQWMSFFKFSRQNNIPVNIHTIRMIRATLLYDTVAVRLCKEVDRFDEYLRFKKFREDQAKMRVTNRIKQQFKGGLDDAIFLKLEEIERAGEKLMYRAQSMLGTPIFNFSSLVGKWFYAVTLLIRLFGQALLVTLLTVMLIAVVQMMKGSILQLALILERTITNPLYQAILVLLVITHTRQILFRMRDQEL